MRIRPFFWLVLLLSCVGVLMFAWAYQPYVAAILHVRVVQQHLVAGTPARLEVKLTDTQGLPIDRAEVQPSAHMTNMDMADGGSRVSALGGGTYRVEFRLYMAGPWAITIHAHATGFTTLQHTLFVQVT